MSEQRFLPMVRGRMRVEHVALLGEAYTDGHHHEVTPARLLCEPDGRMDLHGCPHGYEAGALDLLLDRDRVCRDCAAAVRRVQDGVDELGTPSMLDMLEGAER
ncbi:hypothetical protein [Actinomyces faecalis]|uniref:hypothetical protein n=1 Tax=Actinomyces faecalis TaxID=2722820 RepID=UPI001554A001|nr:hypothetical protein [Actinomyces faecalis]